MGCEMGETWGETWGDNSKYDEKCCSIMAGLLDFSLETKCMIEIG